ncbi:GH116 family glycosyl hydrolase [Vibrio hangzhouensis]|uniref:GH116 family glycosyl hydrolase n=1 Tax=Vibrio hangzhouensis TaxID=462991 RepID=UPI001C97E089|nr:GH116 family glycosyl hydrolase [Vibrio hangzhouensis]MBY6196044.1 glycoside hydrolase family 116 protein [Vibrio hangzhouensis]
MNTIKNTTYSDRVSQLCAKGNAVEFIQPWYVPISTTPENTGMAVGGIGNAFTLTPLGSTPNFSFIPGIFLDAGHEDINFNNFFVSCMDNHSLQNLYIGNEADVVRYLSYFPASFCGEKITDSSSGCVIEKIKNSLSNLRFYSENEANFERWETDFSEKTLRYIEEAPNSLMTQILVAIDFFDGLLTNKSAQLCSLTADSNSGVRAINREQIHYQAMYPIARYDYAAFNDIDITRNVVSPIVQHDKRLCSLPLHWNHFSVRNNAATTKLVTLVQPLVNLIGSTYRKGRDGVQDSFCTLTQNPINQIHKTFSLYQESKVFKGVALESQSPYAADIEGQVCFGIQADSELMSSSKISVSVKPSLYSSQYQDVVKSSLQTGRTNGHFDCGIYSGRESLQAMVCVQIELAPNESLDLRFVQVMDHSKIALNGWESQKAYTQFYPQQDRVKAMLVDVLPELEQIESRIDKQHADYLASALKAFDSEDCARRYTTMAMNTLSFLAESTVWDNKDKFLVKECVDYPFFNSLDVYFYGSFSLLYLLPELDGCVMRDFADAILASDSTQRRYWEYADKPTADLIDDKYSGVRAIKGAVIHDLGSPFDIQPDAYNWHNVKEWKDLAPKYILMVYRHFVHTQDLAVVKQCWPAIVESIDYLSALIEKGDVIPLTRGTDDTFDNLSSHGISIYCASLWVAGLKVASKLAQLVGETERAEQYQLKSVDALQTLERALWDERNGYYHFFATPVQISHLNGKTSPSLEAIGLSLSGEKVADKNILNAYLDAVDESSELSMLEQRMSKKQRLLELAPEVFTPAYKDILLDSDNSFGDALLADSYLKLIGDEGLFSDDKVSRTLDFIYRVNFKENSPKLGVANMTLADGAPHDAFQAQDVWIGVQYSVATALKLSGKKQQAEELIDSVYNALYHYAKIPFAAPEGFNCSVAVSVDSIAQQFQLTEQQASLWFDSLKSMQSLLSDGRVNPNLTLDGVEFCQSLSGYVETDSGESLHRWLLNTGLKYTAGRYFRPGMIFAYLF